MMKRSPPRERSRDVRHRAEERFARSKQRSEQAREAWIELDKQRAAEAVNTARLRALRLAKEAADRKAASSHVAPEKAAAAKGAVASKAALCRAAQDSRK